MSDPSGGEIIKTIQWSFDALCKLLDIDHKTRKDRFEKLIEPLFSDMTQIHGSYKDMFYLIKHIIPQDLLNGNAKIPIYNYDTREIESYVIDKTGSSEYTLCMMNAKRVIVEERMQMNTLRITARSASTQILKKAHNQYEKRFCWAILSYFLDTPYERSEEEMDRVIHIVENQGFHSIINTPSNFIREKLFEETDTTKIIHLLNSKWLTLLEKYTIIAKAFNDIRVLSFS